MLEVVEVFEMTDPGETPLTHLLLCQKQQLRRHLHGQGRAQLKAGG